MDDSPYPFSGGSIMRKIFIALAACLLVGADSKEDALTKEMEKLQGEWSMVSGERDGQVLPEDRVKSGKRVLKGDRITVTVAGQVFLKAKITIDPTKKPKTIDYTITDGPNKGKMQLGIYELDGDMVKFCSSPPEGERPTEFTSKEGSGRTLSVWKRAN
jgi:uncharacterized protein (TIGR03067 family)